jgi:PAS domain S-box-containing protein
MLRISNTGLIVAFLLIVALLLVNTAIIYQNTVLLREDAQAVQHSHEVIEAIYETRSAIKDAETGQRGYLITAAPQYLQPYHDGIASIQGSVEKLSALLEGDPAQRARMPELRARIRAKTDELQATIALRDASTFDKAREQILSGSGRREMEEISSITNDMQSREESLLAERSEKAQRTFRGAILSASAATAVSVFLLGAAVVLIRRNIAARTRATLALAEQSDLLRTTLASIVEGIVVTDLEGRVLFLNRVAEQMSGAALAGVEGRSISAVFDVRDGDTRAPTVSTALLALRAGAVQSGTGRRLLVGKNGEERAIEDSAAPLVDGSGNTFGAVLAVRDVTEARANERRIQVLLHAEQRNADRWRQIAAASSTLNSAHSRDSVLAVLREEAKRILGLEEAVVVSDPADLPGPPGPPALLSAPLTGRGGRPLGYVHLRGAALREAGGGDSDESILRQLAQVAAVAIENARLYEELREGDRRKDEFLATLAHELRNPLAPMRNSLQILRSPQADESDRDKAMTMLERQVALLVRLVDDLLDVSRITRGKVAIQKEVIDLAEIVGQALEISRPILHASGATLAVDLPQERVMVCVDPARIAQVLSNLLNNAAKYTERGGHIWLSCKVEGDDIVINVRDDGIGIPAEMLPNIFDMFWQLEHALERAQGGLGIGLTLVRQLVELHGGRAEAHSAGLGLGSEFIVRLPARSTAEIDAEPEAPPTVPMARPLESLRILVVDDNLDSAESLALLLRLQGHEVHTAHDGVQALGVEVGLRPQIVLLDIGLPKMNGYEAARALRLRRGGELTIVAMTGWGQDSDRLRSQDAGFDHHLVKPVDPNLLQKILAAAQSSRS